MWRQSCIARDQYTNYKLISVLLPVKNGGNTLFAALESLQEQSYSDFECIIINDHSNDNACETISKQFDNRFKVINSHSAGIVAALNTGLKASSKPLIARMDADDISLNTRFEQQVAFLKINKAVDFCGSKIEYFSDSKTIDQGLKLYQDWINAQETHQQITQNMFVECAIPHPSFMIRRSLFEKIGPYQDNGWAEDYDLMLRAYIHKARFGKPKDILLKWRDHHQRLSRNDQRYQKHAFINAKAYYFSRSPIYQTAKETKQKIIIWGAGKTGKMLFKQLQTHEVRISAFVDISKKLIGSHIQNVLIHDAMTFDYENHLIIIAVGSRGIRQKIEDHLKHQTKQIDIVAMT